MFVAHARRQMGGASVITGWWHASTGDDGRDNLPWPLSPEALIAPAVSRAYAFGGPCCGRFVR